jgi:hypothetical protein
LKCLPNSRKSKTHAIGPHFSAALAFYVSRKLWEKI